MNIFRAYNTLTKYSNIVRIICGKNKKMDMLLSKLLLKVNYSIYIDFGFYSVPWNLRRHYMINDLSYAFENNPGVTANNHDDKIDLTKKIHKYIKRKVVFTDNLSYCQFVEFSKTLTSFFYKPVDGDGGHGIQKFSLSDNVSLKEIYNKIKLFPIGLLEETVVQHKDMNLLCPTVLQTIRFTIIKREEGPQIVSAFIRSSTNKNSIVDNACSGGVFADINVETGCIQSNAFCILSVVSDISKIDKRLTTAEGLDKHPITGTVFMGFKIPYFKEAKDLVLDMAKNIDFYGRKFLGFDIAISATGPEVIEVNTTRPGIYVWQMMYKKKPLRAVMDKIIKG